MNSWKRKGRWLLRICGGRVKGLEEMTLASRRERFWLWTWPPFLSLVAVFECVLLCLCFYFSRSWSQWSLYSFYGLLPLKTIELPRVPHLLVFGERTKFCGWLWPKYSNVSFFGHKRTYLSWFHECWGVYLQNLDIMFVYRHKLTLDNIWSVITFLIHIGLCYLDGV